MTVIRNTQNYYEDEDRNRPDRMVYDLNEEKKRIAESTEEIKKELWEKWQKRYARAQIFPNNLNNVNPNLVDFLLSFNNTLFYNDLAKKFNLSQTQRDTLSQTIWEIAINKNWQENNNLLSSKLNLDPEISSQIAQLINQNILFKAKELSESSFDSNKRVVAGEQKKEVKNINISLSQAIQKYPQLGEQLVTSSPIKLRIFPQPVRPSIKNWIEDYRSMMGAQRHGMMERGNYVFHSENTKKLTAGDRKKLAEVLRSLDEDVALKVDPDRQEVVFEIFEEKKPVEKMPNYQPESSAEKFPVANQVSSAQSSPRFGEASGIAYGRQNQNNNVFERPLPRRERIVSQNTPNSAIQEKNRDNFFGNYQQKMEPVKPEMPKPSYQTPVQPSQNMGNNRNENYVVKTEQLKRSSVPIRPSLAGKSYEEINNDPKIRGNVVDLRN